MQEKTPFIRALEKFSPLELEISAKQQEKVNIFLKFIQQGAGDSIDEKLKTAGLEFVYDILKNERSPFYIEIRMGGGMFPKIEIFYSFCLLTILAGLFGLFSIGEEQSSSFGLWVYACIVLLHILALVGTSKLSYFSTPLSEVQKYPGFFERKGTNLDADILKKKIADLFGIYERFISQEKEENIVQDLVQRI